MVGGVKLFEQEQGRITAVACRDNAMWFSAERFRVEFKEYVMGEWEEFVRRKKIL